MATKLIRVYEVLADGPEDGPSGPAADGTFIHRFTKQGEAEAFAAKNTCYGRPAKALVSDVPRRIAERWGMA